MFSKNDQAHVLEQVGNSWFKLKEKNIFVTGATGFVGKWLIGSLLLANDIYSLNCKVTVLTRNARGFREANEFIAKNLAVSFINNDVRLLNFDGGEYDFVIHAATDIAISNSPIDTYEVCAFGTRAVLDFAIKAKASNFLLLSSGAVYGTQPLGLNAISESYGGTPDRVSEISAYGLGKMSAEWMVSQYGRTYGLNTKIARCFALVGPYLPMDKHFAIGNFIKDIVNGDPIVINGDGTPIRTYLYSADLAVWLWRIILDGEKGDIFNVGGDRQISIYGLADLVRSVLNSKVEIIVKNNAIRKSLAERYVPDIRFAKNKLDLSPIISLEESIENTSKWFVERSKR